MQPSDGLILLSGLDGRLRAARRAEHIADFEAGGVGLKPVRIEEFCTLVFVNLDPEAAPLADQSGGSAATRSAPAGS